MGEFTMKKIIIDSQSGGIQEMEMGNNEIILFMNDRIDVVPLPAKLSQYAWEIEVGGITINGIRIDTSDRSKLLINGMYNLAAQGNPSETRKFKSKDGEVEITNTQAMAVAVAVGEHVQKRINAEGAVLSDIEAGIITSFEDAKTAFDALMTA